MILDIGEKVHILERRLFPDDLRRHFLGEVLKCEGNMVRTKGYAWVFNNVRGIFIRKPEIRERVFYIGERHTVFVIPPDVDLNKLVYIFSKEKGLVVTDQLKFSLDVTEFSAMR